MAANKVVYDTLKMDSFKKASVQKEKEIFSDKDFIYNHEAKDSRNWWDIFMEWLERLLGRPFSKNPEQSYTIIKYIFITIFLLGLLFILWKSTFSRMFKGEAKELQGLSFADLPEDIEGIQIDRLIEEAFLNGNYRLAIRWSFLKLLQGLNKQGQIAWQPAKTNMEYQQELKDSRVKDNFMSLSLVFEYVWYGETLPTRELCTEYKSRVEKFMETSYA